MYEKMPVHGLFLSAVEKKCTKLHEKCPDKKQNAQKGENMKLEILELLVKLAVLAMAGIVIPAFKKWLEAKTDNETLEKVRCWAYAAVYAAEQIYNHADKIDPDGSMRKKYAHNAVMKICTDSGICITNRELDVLIEAAVNTLNSIPKEPEVPCAGCGEAYVKEDMEDEDETVDS